MKTLVKLILQRLFGFRNYLYIFSLFIIRKLKWDRNEKDFLYFMNLLPEKGTVLDIGANLGVMSCHLARKFPRRKIYAFEPIPYNYHNLLRIKARYGLDNLSCHQLALGDKPGELEMIMPVEKSVRFHGLAHVRHASIREHNEGEIFNCPVNTLDDFPPLKEERNLTGIKIDVENFEYFVLKGGQRLIQENMPIIYSELWDNENRQNTISFLEHLGYKTMVRMDSGLVDFDPEAHTTQNFFFLPTA
ncbi:MAG: FkbM family methyltransferase [Bacteroidales bacterium]|nr:FkbM family methyltransferase [Bacteroidales bacterium]